MFNEKSMLLCEGRHVCPAAVDGAVFHQTIEDPTDINALLAICDEKIGNIGCLNLYVTGLTVCVGAVVRYCYKRMISLVLYHYDNKTGEYYPQVIFNEQDMQMMRELGWY